MTDHVFNWRPDPPDPRDLIGAFDTDALREAYETLPISVDLRSGFPSPPYDQGQLGSCTGNAWAGAVEYERHHEADTMLFAPSRLFIYYEERKILGTVSEDSGAYLRNGAAVVHKLGAPPERDWPYTISKFTVAPPAHAYTDAAAHRASGYQRVPRSSLRTALAAGHVIPFGFTVYESFESSDVARTGIVPMPSHGEKILGGHATVLCGYDEPSQRFIVRNSWGVGWGQAGYFTMPYAYLANSSLASDFWTILREA